MATSYYSHKTRNVKATPRNGRLLDAATSSAVPAVSGGGGGGGSVTVEAEFDIRQGAGIEVAKATSPNLIYTISHGKVTAAGSTGNLDDVFVQNITLDQFGHVTGIESVRIAASLDDRYLRKDIDDTAHGNISFDLRIGSTVYLSGWDGKGWRIEADGAAELEGIRLRSDLFLGGKVGSPSFASGFTGWGWEIDTPTASGTVDNWTVRKSMKVYELVYSQIYGLSGSSMVTDFNKIESVTPLGTNRYKCVMDDMDGEMFMNLRDGDIVRIQQRDGWNIRYSYAEVENVTNETFDLKVLEGDAPIEGDVAFRMGSTTDPDRQGLIYLTSSDDKAPYIDVLDGIDGTSFEGKTKVRLGNLRGLTVDGVPLDMYGIYIDGGIFQHSTYYLDNGNTIEQQFTIMDGQLRSIIEGIRDDISSEEGNILRNAAFASNLAHWTQSNTVRFIPVPGGFLWLPQAFYVDKEAVADIYRDGSRNVLRIRNSTLTQHNATLRLPTHDHPSEDGTYTYSFSFRYRVLRAGTLRAGISGTALYQEQALEPTDDYGSFYHSAKWNEKGDFTLSFSGEILIYAATLRNDAAADAYIYLATGIEQSEEQIKLWATKQLQNLEGEIYQEFDSEISVMADQISATVREINNLDDYVRTAGWITRSDSVTIFAEQVDDYGLVSESRVQSLINVAVDNITISSDMIKLEGYTTINGGFRVDTSGNMYANSGKIGDFDISAGSIISNKMKLYPSSGLYFEDSSRGIVSRFGAQTIPSSTGLSCNLYLRNTDNSGLGMTNGACATLEVGSARNWNGQVWLACNHYSGWGAGFEVAAVYVNDTNSMNRTAITISNLLTKAQVQSRYSGAYFVNVIYDTGSGLLCFEP